jgi:hypothetical protein
MRTRSQSVKIAVAAFWLTVCISLFIWLAGPSHYVYLQTIAFALTLAAVVWYAELTRRIYREIKRQAKVSIDTYRIHRISVSAEWILKLEDRFESPEYLKDRALAAKHLLSGDVSTSLKHVWDFFETVGLLTKRHILDEEMVWNTFFTWLNCYWQASLRLLEKEQELDPLLWEHVRYLFHKMADCEQLHDPDTKQLSLSAERIAQFLEEEVALYEESKQQGQQETVLAK